MPLPADTIPRVFESQARRLDGRTFLKDKHDKVWRDHSWADLDDQIRKLRGGLAKLGIGAGDRVAILAENGPHWIVMDQAVLGLGGVVVPLYTTSGAEEMRHVLEDSGARLVAVYGDALIKKVRGLGKLPDLEGAIAIHPEAAASDDETLEVVTADQISQFEPVGSITGGGEDLATLIYTSGTTGMPKGVMLTHRNILSNCEANLEVLGLGEDDMTLSFLPIAHAFERTAGYYTVMAAGATIAFAEGLAQIPHNLLEVEPTVVLTVPRLLEAIYQRVMRTVDGSMAARRIIFRRALAAGIRASFYRHRGARPPLLLRMRMALYRRLVFRRIRAIFGSRIRYLISGGAPLPIEVNRLLAAAEVPIVEGYGLTEAAPVVSVNLHGHTRVGSVGRPLRGVQIKTLDDGELLVRGPNVMKGYFGLERETREVLDEQGWLHTGDIVKIDAEGYIRITDRKKEIIVLSGGKNVSPAHLETRLAADPFIAQACVIGDRRKHLAALIVPNFDNLSESLAKLGLNGRPPEETISDPRVRELIHDRIRAINKSLSDVEAIVDFRLLAHPFTQENGELTPTLKLRRRVVHQHYHDDIEALYRPGA
jgi:long-chain acyl-CoA synthetase